MAIYPDPSEDYSRHPSRRQFEQLVKAGNAAALKHYMNSFEAKGHNPENPRDMMWAIMGITPEYFDHLIYTLEERALTADLPPAPRARTCLGKSKRHSLTFAPEDD